MSAQGNSRSYRSRRSIVAQIQLALSRAVPSQCAICHAWPAERICAECRHTFLRRVHRCTTCAAPLPAGLPQCGDCLLHPPPLASCIAAVDYAYPWADLITDFKFHRDPTWAASLGRLLRQAPQARAAVDAAMEAADWIVPIPLSATRLAERGFNQAQWLAEAIAPRRKIRCDLLLRPRETQAQSGLAREARLRNLRRAFACAPLLTRELAGRRVLIVDDVMTTGATLDCAAEVLLAAGAATVHALVLARRA